MQDPHSPKERCPSCGARLRILPAINDKEVVRLCPACGLQPRSRGATIHTQPLTAGGVHRFRQLIEAPGTGPLPEWMIEDLPRQAREQIERLTPAPGPRLGPRLSEALSQALKGRGLHFNPPASHQGNGRAKLPSTAEFAASEGWIASRIRCQACDAGLSAGDRICPWCSTPRTESS
jgi:predicted RNA-binding Zn-ribbon protein involved in translation (DUF1610 family)